MRAMVNSSGRRRRFGLGSLFLLIGIVAFLGLALAATIVGMNEHRKADWPVTDGQVIDVAKRVNTTRDRDGGSRTTTSWVPVVKFTVDDKEYVFSASTGGGKRPEIGSTVQVRYNPEDPSQAGLDGELVWVVVLLGGMGVFFLVIFGGVGVAITRRGGSRSSGWAQNQLGAVPPPPPASHTSVSDDGDDGPIDPSVPR